MSLDAGSFERFFADCYAHLCLFVFRIVASDLVVEDIATDAFVVVWERREQLSDEIEARKLLYRTARNAALNHLRTERGHEQAIVGKASDEASMPGVGSWRADPERELQRAEINAAVRAAIDTLPPGRRQVYSLRWEQGWSTAEIAETLGLSQKTVEMHVTLAHKALRTALARYRS